ncbi:PREDICTED: uncharacterized protein LOC108381464, partial [Rhagoletis zephyria]|uniref:uncharacterized protein LOC108381464 n=1 Tax=Rhagoletis zephyria TaxID=28612 RepID=UPI0008119CF1
MSNVIEALHGCVQQVFYWSDSTTVLTWIRAQPSKWNVYVANRVAEIQHWSTISQWRYVPTHDNPADCASKGVMPRDLPNHTLWWNGQAWLKAHIITLHGGVQLMLNYVRRKYWVSNARHLAQVIIKRCLTCYKYTTKTAEQLMGNLPPVRLIPARPFLHSGVDYAGPIDIRQSSLRNAKVSKGYICIFVCMVTKAIHLEAVSSLTTDAFVAAFRRFTSRRGKCTQIYSDRGTNFVDASNALQVMQQSNLSSLPQDLKAILASEGITWNFIPPASPHFGGLWEAGVKSTIYHFKRIIQDRALNFEELCTLLCRKLDALTPAHFLIGEPTINIPDEALLEFTTRGVSRWRMVEQYKQHFWRRWYAEYLSRLQSRPKWTTVRANIKIGDLVLLYDEKTPPGKWPLARIADVHPGQDGLVRVVTLKCND